MEASDNRAFGTTPLLIEETAIGDVTMLRLEGKMTATSSRDSESECLWVRVNQVIEHGCRKVILDLEGVSFMDSTCVGEIVAAYKLLHRMSGELKLPKPSARVHALLDCARLLSIIESFQSETEALCSLGERTEACGLHHPLPSLRGRSAVILVTGEM